MRNLFDDGHDHDYVFLNVSDYSGFHERRFILQQYCCIHCGLGMQIYLVPEVTE